VYVKFDSVSKGLTMLGGLIVVYMSTFEGGAGQVLFPAFLLMVGIVLTLLDSRQLAEVDSLWEEETQRSIALYTAGGFIALLLVGGALAYVPAEMTGTNALLYSVMMAVAETIFFQGFILNFILRRLGSPLASVLVASLASMIYHFAVYRTSIHALLYVLLGFVILNYIAVKSGRLSCPMLVHILNNVLSSLGGG
jgi:membrane protease YdiL (CAAX protease family)